MGRIKITHIQGLDQRRDFIIPGDKETTLDFCARHFIKIGQEALAKRNSFYVALSGGSTPKAIFSRLTRPEMRSQLDWNKVFLFWSDERCVPPESSESNYRAAMDAGFRLLPIPDTQIFRMQGELHPEESAAAYEKLLEANLPDQIFDLVTLGMGEDCHTASLFPKTHGLHAEGRLAIANFLPDMDVWRLTLTFACINKARHIVIYVLGENKKQAVATALLTKPEYEECPIRNIGTPSNKSLWILDDAAAEQVRAII